MHKILYLIYPQLKKIKLLQKRILYLTMYELSLKDRDQEFGGLKRSEEKEKLTN